VATVVVARHPERVGSPSSASVGTRGYPFDAKDEEGNPTDRIVTDREAVANDPVQTGPLVEAREAGNRELYRATWDALIDGHNSPELDRYEAYVGDMLTQHNLVDVYYTLARFTISEEANACGEGSGLAPKIIAPTLVTRGDRDLVSPREMAEYILADVSTAELVEFEDCRHSPPVDALDEPLKTVESLLAE
jgi:pimeloyl-ACP methyl ester carboxylesterase